MTRPPPRAKHTPEFTTKIVYCRGCNNEIHPDMPVCLVCGTENPRAKKKPDGEPEKP